MNKAIQISMILAAIISSLFFVMVKPSLGVLFSIIYFALCIAGERTEKTVKNK